MRDPAALYEAVMGKLWENQQVRGKAYGRIEARISGRRQGRSYSQTGRASLRKCGQSGLGSKPGCNLQTD